MYKDNPTFPVLPFVPLFHGSHFLTTISQSSQYAQELLSTFSTTLGEVSLIPATGGIFTITLLHRPSQLPPPPNPTAFSTQPDLSTSLSTTSFPDTRYLPRPLPTEVVIWDRKTDGGFPETTELKNRVRNVVEPGRDLGHVDRSLKKAAAAKAEAVPEAALSVESSDGGGVVASSSAQGDAVMADMGSTIPAEKCADCL